MKEFFIALLAVVALPAAASASEGFSRSNLKALDQSLRVFSNQCVSLGFNPIATPEPNTMSDKMSAQLLLREPAEATLLMERWRHNVRVMEQLIDPQMISDAAERAGALLTAAVIDPSTHDEAKQKYVAVMTSVVEPMLSACRGASGDPFLGAHYLSGSGSLASFETQWEQDFDVSVAEQGVAKGR